MRGKTNSQRRKNVGIAAGYYAERGNKIFALVSGFVCFALILTMVLTEAMPKTYDIVTGEQSKYTILATMDIVDGVTTEANRKAARNAVADKYLIDGEATSEINSNIENAFLAMEIVAGKGEQLRKQAGVDKGTLLYNDAVVRGYCDKEMAFLKISENDDIASDVINVLNTAVADIVTVKVAVKGVLNSVLASGIKEQDISVVRTLVINSVNEEATGLSGELISISTSIINKYVKANNFYDEESTELARNAAAAAVEETVIKKGNKVVEKDELVKQNQVEMLSEMGLLNDGKPNFNLIGGMAVLIFVLLALVAAYVVIYEPDVIQYRSRVLLLCVLLCFGVLLSILAKSINVMLVQVTLGTLLIAMLLHVRLALIANVSLSIILALIVSDETGLFNVNAIIMSVTSIVSGTVAVYLCSKTMLRGRIFLTGVIMGVVGMVTSAAMWLIVAGNSFDWVIQNSLWCLAGGLLAAVLCIGTLPVWEALFGILTPMKLLELTNSNRPLQRRLAIEAPGTYHHSIVVANLAEAAADEIGADTMLVRAGAIYHDIGKLAQPECFAENQSDDQRNFHELLPASESAKMIMSHVSIGVELAKKDKLPKGIVDIIKQHHGTSRIEFFYSKAKETDEYVNEKAFCYPGPKPQTKEAAIILLADGVEASVRALNTINSEEVQAQIKKMIYSRLSAGELDECDLTLKELHVISGAFAQVMSGVYHERVKYPAQEEENKQADEKNDN